ncbi:MAG: ABC transporter permease [Bacteroidetes bacterium]|nr:MAG: ABC transporter permease [Bacteroidota bacterium]
MSVQLYKSPAFYIRKRLFSNKLAVFGLTIILIAHLIAVLGYLIMPDGTPNVTEGSVEISKKTPFFKTKILKTKKNIEVDKVNLFRRLYNGQESEYMLYPISSYKIDGDKVFFNVGRDPREISYTLLDAVKAISLEGSVEKLSKTSEDTVTYLDMAGDIRYTTLHDLKRDFEANNIEERTFYLGTDPSGRDMLSLLLYGTRISLFIGFISVIISLVVGISLGAMAGYFGGIIDDIVMWIMTVFWSIPSIMLVVAISMALQSKGLWVVFIAIGLTMWVEIALLVRGEVKSIKGKLYIDAARTLGVSNFNIIYKHILPNILGSLIVITTSNFASAILTEAGLSFLGLGVQSPTPSWGIMIKEGFKIMMTPDSWHIILLPSLCISLLVLAFNLLGNGLRDAYDPKNS